MKYLITLFFIISSLLHPALAMPASGDFVAQKSCALYQSKNKQTNPDGLYTQQGQTYAIAEYLGSVAQPTWFRVITNATNSPKRWLAANCGKVANFKATPRAHNQDNNGQCRIAHRQNSYVLALSWQKGFCRFGGRHKAECKALTRNPQLTAANEFSLHGLWPNKASCNLNYGYCGKIKVKPDNFCQYPALDLSSEMRSQLEQVMPSAAHGSCLQRHEYWKHGACMTDTPDQYFKQAIALTNEANTSQFVRQFIQQNKGNKVSRHKWNQAFDNSFGKDSHLKVKLICQRAILTEIQLSLPLELNQTLTDLLSHAAPIGKGTCPEKFRLVN